MDYVFVRDVQFVGEAWPNGDQLWECTDPDQRSNAEQAARILGSPLGAAVCLPTDHVGILALLQLPQETATGLPATPQPGGGIALGWFVAISALMLMLVIAGLIIVRRRRR